MSQHRDIDVCLVRGAYIANTRTHTMWRIESDSDDAHCDVRIVAAKSQTIEPFDHLTFYFAQTQPHTGGQTPECGMLNVLIAIFQDQYQHIGGE